MNGANRLLPARDQIDAYVEGRATTGIRDRLLSTWSFDDILRVLMLYPVDSGTESRLELLDVLTSDIPEARRLVIRRIFELRSVATISTSHVDALRQHLEALGEPSILTCMALHKLAGSAAILGCTRDAEMQERELVRHAAVCRDPFFAVLARIVRFERILSDKTLTDAQHLLTRIRGLLPRASGVDLLEPIVRYCETLLSIRRGDADCVWSLLALRQDYRLFDHLRDHATLIASQLLQDRQNHASALALKLELVHRKPRPAPEPERLLTLLSLIRDLICLGDLEFAWRHLVECESMIDQGEEMRSEMTTIRLFEAALLAKKGKVAIARQKFDRVMAEARFESPDSMTQVFAETMVLEAEQRFAEAIHVGRIGVARSYRSQIADPLAVEIARRTMRLIRDHDADSKQLSVAIDDCQSLAARCKNIDAMSEAWFTLGLSYARSATTSEKAVEACRMAEQLTRHSLQSLEVDRDLLFKLIAPDAAATTVLSSLVGRMLKQSRTNLHFLFEVMRSISEQASTSRDLAQQLATSQKRMRRIVDSLPLITWTSEGTATCFALRHFEGAVREIFGESSQKPGFAEGEWLAAVHEADRPGLIAALEAVVRDLEGRTHEFRVCRGDKTHRNVEIQIRPIVGPDTDDGCLYGIMTDVTERKELERELRLTNKMDALGRMAGGIAREYQTLLEDMRSGLADLSSLVGGHPAADAILNHLERSAISGMDLTARLRSFAEQDGATRSTFDLDVVVSETAALAERILERSVRVDLEAKEGTRLVHHNPAAITEAILSLIAEADPPRSGEEPIKISTAVERDGCTRLRISNLHGATGRFGIERAFEPDFGSGDADVSSGLTMSIAYRTMRDAGGSVSIDTTDDGDRSVNLVFPPLDDEQLRSCSGTSLPPRKKRRGAVLLVDDDEMILSMGSVMLSDAGYRVVTARDGLEALAVFESDPKRFDLVITDVRMPRCDGRALSERLRRMSRVPILLMTGYSEDLPSGSRIEWPFAVLQKPFTTNALVAKINSLQIEAPAE